MDLMAIRRGLMAQSINPIPSIYQRVKYLESSGTQAIYTNVPASSGVECEAKVAWKSDTATDGSILGGRKADRDRIMLIHAYAKPKWYFGYGSGHVNIETFAFGTVYTVEAKAVPGEQYLKIDGNTIYTGTDANSYSNEFNLSVFACTKDSASTYNYKSSSIVYEMKIKYNGSPAANYVPCVRISDSVPGLYDLVSKTFLTNVGTGQFGYETLDGTHVSPT